MAATGELAVVRMPDTSVLVRVAGRWHLAGSLPDAAAVDAAIDGPPAAGRLAFDAGALTGWDSSLAVVVTTSSLRMTRTAS